MEKARERRDRFPPSAGWPQVPTDIDYEVRALGGRTHVFDTLPENIQAQKAPVTKEKRLEELTREVGRLRQELDYWRSLARSGSSLVTELDKIVKQMNIIIDTFDHQISRCNTSWTDRAVPSAGSVHSVPVDEHDNDSFYGQDTRPETSEETLQSIAFTPFRTSDKRYDFQIVNTADRPSTPSRGSGRHNWL
ncbi:uncharacterized protein CCOS01_17103 [Colletotrichum costaricense]|uniref:Uncharacterized protein n=1 Tax=Colletotrichum costaricense TaxID=1209916 RepID=A0AAI9YE82_9PEZI|nr:uncharacterized protein CCOS01_17103 [Colletotrichum costaricense]KAK1502835.1 hypothetical protein CCOS01_17103 [Colletotrichum costaricense]